MTDGVTASVDAVTVLDVHAYVETFPIALKVTGMPEQEIVEPETETVENTEKNVNFVNEEVTEQSIFDKLKNNNLEC